MSGTQQPRWIRTGHDIEQDAKKWEPVFRILLSRLAGGLGKSHPRFREKRIEIFLIGRTSYSGRQLCGKHQERGLRDAVP
jgi:hypothetical protein